MKSLNKRIPDFSEAAILMQSLSEKQGLYSPKFDTEAISQLSTNCFHCTGGIGNLETRDLGHSIQAQPYRPKSYNTAHEIKKEQQSQILNSGLPASKAYAFGTTQNCPAPHMLLYLLDLQEGVL